MTSPEQSADSQPNSAKGGYDFSSLYDPELNAKQTVEDAAVRHEKEPKPDLTAKEWDEIDARLRERHSRPPLTEDQTAILTRHRGRRMTPEEIRYINSARANGIHTNNIV